MFSLLQNIKFFLEMIKLSLDVREQIVDVFQKGENHTNIARALRIGRTTIRKVCLKFQETGSVIDKKRSGRPKNTITLPNFEAGSLTKVELIQLL